MSSEQNDCAFNPVIGKICSPAFATFSYICVVGYFNFPWIRRSVTHFFHVESKEAEFMYSIEECFRYEKPNGPTRCWLVDMHSQLDIMMSSVLASIP